MPWDGRERKGRCRGPGAAGDLHLQPLLGKGAFAIPGDTEILALQPAGEWVVRGWAWQGIFTESQDDLV